MKTRNIGLTLVMLFDGLYRYPEKETEGGSE
jgi:hypothetical protein